MPKSQARIRMEEEYVNLYRLNWGSTVGLTTKKVESWSDRELSLNLEGQRRFPGKFRDPTEVTYKW